MLAQESLSLYWRAREIRVASWGASCQRSSQKSMPRNRPCGEADGPLPHSQDTKIQSLAAKEVYIINAENAPSQKSKINECRAKLWMLGIWVGSEARAALWPLWISIIGLYFSANLVLLLYIKVFSATLLLH